jgi:hypothetical protein
MRRLQSLAIHISTARALQVLDIEAALTLNNPRMPATDRAQWKWYIVVGGSANGDFLLFKRVSLGLFIVELVGLRELKPSAGGYFEQFPQGVFHPTLPGRSALEQLCVSIDRSYLA